jgi:hypothetical protein
MRRPEFFKDREVSDPWAHYDAPALPEREISHRLLTGNTAQSQPGDAIAAEQRLNGSKISSKSFLPQPSDEGFGFIRTMKKRRTHQHSSISPGAP